MDIGWPTYRWNIKVLPNIFHAALYNTWYGEWTLYALSILSVTKQDTRYIPQNVVIYSKRLSYLCIMLSKSSSTVHLSCVRRLT